MGGKYEIRYYLSRKEKEYAKRISCNREYETVYTNNWFEFIKIRLTRNVIYYKIIVDRR